MKITKQKLESLILEEIKSLQEGSPFEEKAKEAQNAWLASRPWTANALEVIRNSKSAADVDDVPSALFRFIEYGENEFSKKDQPAWIGLENPKYNHDWIKGGLQGNNGDRILKIINDAFEISKTIPLKPFASGLGKGPDRANPLSMDPLISPPRLKKDPDGYKYITFATKSGSWVVIETPPTLNRDQPGIAIGKAPAGQGLAENKMKLTKQQLKHIIKEEITNTLQEGMLDRFRGSAPSPADKEMESSKGFASHSAEETIQPEFHDVITTLAKGDNDIYFFVIDELIKMAKAGELNILNLRQMSEEEKSAIVASVMPGASAAYPDKKLNEKKKKKKACKPSKGKRFAKRVNGKCRSFGQAGKAKGGGDRIRPGTKKGDAYCARSAGIKKCKNPPCANTLSRRKWKCRGKKSMKEELVDEGHGLTKNDVSTVKDAIDILKFITKSNVAVSKRKDLSKGKKK